MTEHLYALRQRITMYHVRRENVMCHGEVKGTVVRGYESFSAALWKYVQLAISYMHQYILI